MAKHLYTPITRRDKLNGAIFDAFKGRDTNPKMREAFEKALKEPVKGNLAKSL